MSGNFFGWWGDRSVGIRWVECVLREVRFGSKSSEKHKYYIYVAIRPLNIFMTVNSDSTPQKTHILTFSSSGSMVSGRGEVLCGVCGV